MLVNCELFRMIVNEHAQPLEHVIKLNSSFFSAYHKNLYTRPKNRMKKFRLHTLQMNFN
jgi:hypothetical protein